VQLVEPEPFPETAIGPLDVETVPLNVKVPVPDKLLPWSVSAPLWYVTLSPPSMQDCPASSVAPFPAAL
jgi:hypothetical protein